MQQARRMVDPMLSSIQKRSTASPPKTKERVRRSFEHLCRPSTIPSSISKTNLFLRCV